MSINLKTITQRVSAMFIIATEPHRFDLERPFLKLLKTWILLISSKNFFFFTKEITSVEEIQRL